MNPPWTATRKGKSELVWGYDPNGRVWVKRVCVLCGKLSERIIGRETAGSPQCKVGRQNGVLTVFSHHVLFGKLRWHKRSPPKKSMLEMAEIKISDACNPCFQQFRGRCRSISRTFLGKGKYLEAPLVEFPRDALKEVVLICLETFYPDKLHLLD